MAAPPTLAVPPTMAVPSTTHEPPAPAPASPRFFALLYTPLERRAAMNCLLALAEELAPAGSRALEPSVAQARLAWWRLEAQRYAAGRAQHPWLSALGSAFAPSAPIDLAALVEAAAADTEGAALHRALYLAAAAVLGASPPTPAVRVGLEQLAMQGWRGPGAVDREPPPALAGMQARLAPLLVWTALAARAATPRSPLQSLTDNMRAWRIARRAIAGRYVRS